MYTLRHTVRFSQDIKKSRFLAWAAPVSDEAAAKAFIAEHGEPAANHNCWAWRIGQLYRFSDDGEPSGTAGRPILQAIDGQDLDQVVVLVTRWFGGVLLGSGGLVRAYGGTAAACLRAAEHIEHVPSVSMRVICVFANLTLVKARLAGFAGARIDSEHFTDTGAELLTSLPLSRADDIARQLIDETSGRTVVKPLRDGLEEPNV